MLLLTSHQQVPPVNIGVVCIYFVFSHHYLFMICFFFLFMFFFRLSVISLLINNFERKVKTKKLLIHFFFFVTGLILIINKFSFNVTNRDWFVFFFSKFCRFFLRKFFSYLQVWRINFFMLMISWPIVTWLFFVVFAINDLL